MRRTLLLALLLPLAATFPHRAAAQVSPSAALAADSAVLTPGDVIRIAVFRQPEFSGDFAVGPEGTIQHPLLADVSVVGVPRHVVRDRLRQALSRYERDPSFVFGYLYRIAVGGEVRLPNLYTLPPETTLGQAVAAGGNVTEFGRLDRVYVLRDGREIVVNLQRPDAATASMRIHSGDQIRVARRRNVLRDVVGPLGAVVGAVAALTAAVRIGKN
ncbi:MAG TPA: polysaccharide biosynthesis/export family protein [Longimicrobium sp.]|nr:polysaccharide biosynthesis/export family protein [Longimicrobium sp.]